MPNKKPMNMITQKISDFGKDAGFFLSSIQSNSPSSIIMGKPGFGKTQMMYGVPPLRLSYSKSRLIAMGCDIEEKDGYIIGTDPDGDKFFTKDSFLHREDGPAQESVSGASKYAILGYLHNPLDYAQINEVIVKITSEEGFIFGNYNLYGEFINSSDFETFKSLTADDIPTYVSYIATHLKISDLNDVRLLSDELSNVPLSHLWKVTGIKLPIPYGFETIVEYERAKQ